MAHGPSIRQTSSGFELFKPAVEKRFLLIESAKSCGTSVGENADKE